MPELLRFAAEAAAETTSDLHALSARLTRAAEMPPILLYTKEVTMSKSTIYTVNATANTVTVGSLVPLGSTVRRYGCNLRQDGNGITATGAGYYLVTVSVTAAPTAAGAVTVTGQKDGVAIIGATATTTAAADAAANLAFSAIVRNTGCDSSILSFALTGTDAAVSNIAVSVVKL